MLRYRLANRACCRDAVVPLDRMIPAAPHNPAATIPADLLEKLELHDTIRMFDPEAGL